MNMAGRARVCDSQESRWLVKLFLAKRSEANPGPQSFPKTKVAASFCFKSRFFPKIKEVLAYPKSQATMSRCEVDKNLMPGVALQPLVGLTPNSVLILFGLRRSGPRRLIQNQIGEFTTKNRVENVAGFSTF